MKKLLAMVLAAAMTLSLCVFPAGAATAGSPSKGLTPKNAAQYDFDIETVDKTTATPPYTAGETLKYDIVFTYKGEAPKVWTSSLRIIWYGT